jgi:hypothetical protein
MLKVATKISPTEATVRPWVKAGTSRMAPSRR